MRFYDDSKATTPGAVLAAVEGCAPAVLIAGGRNKGLDLSVLATAAPRLRGVVAIGEAAEEVAAAFAGVVPVTRAQSMADAVDAAAALAGPGDSVVLSPACASFDWYGSYAGAGRRLRPAARVPCRDSRPGPKEHRGEPRRHVARHRRARPVGRAPPPPT